MKHFYEIKPFEDHATICTLNTARSLETNLKNFHLVSQLLAHEEMGGLLKNYDCDILQNSCQI